MSPQSESIYSFFFLESVYSCFAHNYNGFGHLVSKPTGKREQQIKRVSTGTGRPPPTPEVVYDNRVQTVYLDHLEVSPPSQWPPSIIEISMTEISNDCALPEKGWNVFRIFILCDSGICILYSRKIFFKYTQIKRHLDMKGFPLQGVWLYMKHFPPKLVQMGTKGARGITIFRLQSIVSSCPPAGKGGANNVFSEIFNEETLSQTNAPGPHGFMLIRWSTTLTREFAFLSGTPAPAGPVGLSASPVMLPALSSVLRHQSLGHKFSPLSVAVAHCIIIAYLPQCVPTNTIPQAAWDREGWKGGTHPAWSREPRHSHTQEAKKKKYFM